MKARAEASRRSIAATRTTRPQTTPSTCSAEPCGKRRRPGSRSARRKRSRAGRSLSLCAKRRGRPYTSGNVASVPVVLCVLLWAAPGEQQALVEYEDRVLRLLTAHQARVLTRVRAVEGQPNEVQLLEFPSEDALRAFLDDPTRVELAALRQRAIARTEVLRVDLVEQLP